MKTTLQIACDTLGVNLTAPGPTVIPHAGRRELCALFAAAGFTRGAEIGVWTGNFSKRLCQLVPRLHLTCVDPWESYPDYHEPKNDQAKLELAYREARARLEPYHCTILRMPSLEAADRVPNGSLDFVYIDGNHERPYIEADLEAWVPKVRRGGIVSGHDFHSPAEMPFIQVEPVVREYTSAHGISPWFVFAGDAAPSYGWVKA